MAKHRITVALLCGAGFTSFLMLVLNVSFLSMPAALFLSPGGIFAALITRTESFGSPLLLLAINALVYSIIVWAELLVFGRGITAEKMRVLVVRLMIPVTILVGLACVPRFNPLWPQGMKELTEQENVLQKSFPLGTGLEDARAVLRSKGIEFYEATEASEKVVLERGEARITASAGDPIISARIETEASEFPCDYDIQLMLVFGANGELKKQYIHRWPICP